MAELLLDYLSNNLPPFELSKFKKLKNEIYKDYTGRPAMAQSRILNYDRKYVTFWYDRHEDEKQVEETLHVYDFIKRLINIFLIKILKSLDIMGYTPKNTNNQKNYLNY